MFLSHVTEPPPWGAAELCHTDLSQSLFHHLAPILGLPGMGYPRLTHQGLLSQTAVHVKATKGVNCVDFLCEAPHQLVSRSPLLGPGSLASPSQSGLYFKSLLMRGAGLDSIVPTRPLQALGPTSHRRSRQHP